MSEDLVVVADFLRRYREDRRAGRVIARSEYQSRYPGYEDLIAHEWARLDAGKDGDGSASAPPEPQPDERIGPYRVLEEIGRGGQGVVYLAEDSRLNRRVALKVLRGLGALLGDPIARFLREAEVASRLDDPRICTVFDTGVERDVAWIAMRHVDGETLAVKIRRAKEGGGDRDHSVFGTSPEPFVAVARLFESAARALHAAHEAGIVHRDLKPGNLMITSAGAPVILDFGLARDDEGGAASLTVTGDVFGTPSYMSPEQVAGRKVRIDRRSDVYSLGVTLFECLTLRRPFESPTREGLYREILTSEPPDPRRLNAAIPKDLRTIVQFCLAKNRDHRYQTAQALANDLEAFQRGRPISVRPVGPIARFARWSKREPAKAALLTVLVVALPTIAALVTRHVQNIPRVEEARLAGLQRQKDDLLSRAYYEIGELRAARAVPFFESVLKMQPESLEAIVGLVIVSLRQNHPNAAIATLDDHAALLGESAAGGMLRVAALHALGREDEAKTHEASIRKPRTAFDFYALGEKLLADGDAGRDTAFKEGLSAFTQAVLLATAPRPFFHQRRMVAAGQAKDVAALRETAHAVQELWPAATGSWFWAGIGFLEAGLLDDATVFLREAIRLDPIDHRPWNGLGVAFHKKGLFDDAIASYREAVKLEPDGAIAHYNLGLALAEKESWEPAIASYRISLQLDRNSAEAHGSLGIALHSLGRVDEAIASYRESIRLNPRHHAPYCKLGMALADKGLLDEAIENYRTSIRLKADAAEPHSNLGLALKRKGALDEAIASYREALRLDPRDALVAHNLGQALRTRGDLDEAIAALLQAAEANPRHAGIQCALGNALFAKGDLDSAVTSYRAAIRLDPDHVNAHQNLGVALLERGDIEDAVASNGQAVRLDPDRPEALCNLGLSLGEAGRIHEALESLRRGHALGSKQPTWSHPSADWVAKYEHLVALEPRFDAILAAGGEPDADDDDLVSCAWLALVRGHPNLAVRWYRAAFAVKPSVAGDERHRFFAAIAAAIVGCDRDGREPHLDESVARGWRDQAMSWLRDELDAWRGASQSRGLKPRQAIRALWRLKREPRLAPIRDPAASCLTPDERRAWQALWADLDALLANR